MMIESLSPLWLISACIGWFILVLACHLTCVCAYNAARFKHYEEFDENPEQFRGKKIEGKAILWWVRYYGSYLPEFWRKPFYLCIHCMGSFWSILPCLLYCHMFTGGFEAMAIVWPMTAFAASGLNTLVAFNLYLSDN